MRCIVPFAFFAFAVPAQSLVLTTDVVDPSRNSLYGLFFGSLVHVPIPLGPVTFPLQQYLNNVSLTVDQLAPSPAPILSIAERVSGAWSFSVTGSVICHLVTTVLMPRPALVPLTVVDSMNTLAGSGDWVLFDAAVDVGDDGTNEFTFSVYTNLPISNPPPLQLGVLADSRGTRIAWQSRAIAGQFSSPAANTSQLDLRFTEPVQEPAYGPVCAGELGCQLVPGSQYSRVLVASLPGDSVLSWLVGGDQQTNIVFAGFACPLLCNPVVILPVPLQSGPNGRKFAVLDGTFPSWPGQVWFAQGIAISGGTFVGTNGVRIQT